MTETLGLIGSGMIGSALARLAVAAGLDVVISNSRGPETLGALVAELGLQARAGTPAEAAEAGDLVVATIPLNAYRQLSAVELAGKTVSVVPAGSARMPRQTVNGSGTLPKR